MSTKDWEVGPVLKDKAGSQGTLFRGGTKFSSPERFPRGYTPDRLNEVRPLVGTNSNFKDYPQGKDGPMGKGTGEARRRVVDNIARSTVPVSHLQGVQFTPGQADLDYGSSKKSDDGSITAGLYHRGSPALRNLLTSGGGGDREANILRNGPTINSSDMARISIRKGYEGDTTPIHEIGHHVSRAIEGVASQHSWDEQGHSGAEEAYADNYAETHYRDRKGNQVNNGTYGGGSYSLNRTDDFWKSYHKNRDSSMYKRWAADQDADYYKRYPEGKQHPDGTYDQPLIHKEYAPQGEEHTTEQPMRINDDAYPEETPWHEKYKW